MKVEVQKDSRVAITYEMLFEEKNGYKIDIIDVGLPTGNYTDVSAFLDGVPRAHFGPSTVVNPGVEVHLEDKTIGANQSGLFKFRAIVGELVYQDTTRKDYASLQITPTWFDSQYVTGTTDLTIEIVLPDGVKLDEAIYQDIPFILKREDAGRTVVGWQRNVSFTGPFRVGVSFPKRGMTNVITLSNRELLERWVREIIPVELMLLLWALSFAGVAFVFFRFSGKTGCVLLVPIFIGIFILDFFLPVPMISNWILVIVAAVIVETFRYKKRSRYLPALVSVEGGGIKRGLTAPEAAVLLELPVKKIVTMILFGMIKKGLIRQMKKDPPIFEIVGDEAALQTAHEYETLMLGAMKNVVDLSEVNLSDVFEKVVKAVVQKMKGFDADETRDYYKKIVERAWIEAKNVTDPKWQNTMDDKVEWLMMDRDFEDRFQNYSTTYIPRPYRSASATPASSIPQSSSLPSGPAPRFSDVAASFAGWVQNTSQNVIASVEGKDGGIVNFASVDKMFPSSGGGGGASRGGGGGGCACACAGCACACACAGGGR